jgi:hypothetical protein
MRLSQRDKFNSLGLKRSATLGAKCNLPPTPTGLIHSPCQSRLEWWKKECPSLGQIGR